MEYADTLRQRPRLSDQGGSVVHHRLWCGWRRAQADDQGSKRYQGGRWVQRGNVERRLARDRLSWTAAQRPGRDRSEACRPQQGQLGDGGTDPRHHGALRDHGVRTHRRLLGRTVSDQDSLHFDVAALSHRQRLVRRHPAAVSHRTGCGLRRYLCRTVVSDHHLGDDVAGRRLFPARDEGCRYRGKFRHRGSKDLVATSEHSLLQPLAPMALAVLVWRYTGYTGYIL